MFKQLIILCGLPALLSAQTLDSLRITEPKKVKLELTADFFTTASVIDTRNLQEGFEPNNIHFYYAVNFNNRIKFEKLKLTTYLFNEYGIRVYFDSITNISEDVYNLKNSLAFPLFRTRFDFNVLMCNKSQFWKHFSYKEDSAGMLQRSLYTAYLSPGYTVYSGGLRYNFWEYSSLEMGIASGRKTHIRNQQIFEERKTNKLYGLEKGQTSITVLGIHLVLNIQAKELFKNFYIENFTQVFADKDSLNNIKSYIFDLNNAFHYIVLKNIRVSLRTKILYDRNIFFKPTIINQFVVGFYLNNEL